MRSKITINQESNTVSYIFLIAFTLSVLSICFSARSVSAAEADIQYKVCQTSQRGMRCKLSLPDEVVAIAIKGENAIQSSLVCSKSARGTRCQSRADSHYAMTENTEVSIPLFEGHMKCMTLARGTRNCNTKG